MSQVAMMLGQNELEAIAADPVSRLELIDLRAGIRGDRWPTEDLSVFTANIAQLRERIAEVDDELAHRPELETELSSLRVDEEEILSSSKFNLEGLRAELERLERELQSVGTQQEAMLAVATDADSVLAAERTLRRGIEQLSAYRHSAVVAPIIEQFSRGATGGLQQVAKSLESMRSSLEATRVELAQRENALRSAAAPLRAELEKAESGLGELTTRVRNIERLLARLETAEQHARDLDRRLLDALDQREAMLAERDVWQEAVFEERLGVATGISAQLEQHVVVVVEHLADVHDFEEGLQQLLKNSSVQTRSTAQAIARDVLPRQLLALIESGDVLGLSAAARITEDRASRVVAHLRNPDALSALAGLTLEDYVDFRLRDGAVTKPVQELSAGQKCAVTLPIFLTEERRALILDQPEDHLDNAYLVSHVVTGMLHRSSVGAQTIVATHNANIPVLGEADRVFAMKSDGVRGSVATHGAFNDPVIVEMITSLMEGGRQAFARRAEFYRRFGGSL